MKENKKEKDKQIRKFLQLVTLSYLINLSLAQISIEGGCPSFDCCKDEFNPLPVEKMTGIWYLYGGISHFFDADTKCTKVNVMALSTDYFYVNTTQVVISSGHDRAYDGFGNFTIKGKVITLVSDLKIPIPYDIIKITPDYLIMLTCLDCGFFTHQGAGLYLYIYTKSEFPAQTLVNEINEKVEQCGVSLNWVQKQDHDGC
ncbi:uncharacterized protein [Chironomus tepperi]|uniref:uncharacterized protein n=1 Tax=Chironomus tepperi TaxID=113505 RepID=UPI00391F09A4